MPFILAAIFNLISLSNAENNQPLQREIPIECELSKFSQIDLNPELSTTELGQYFSNLRAIGRVNEGPCKNFLMFEVGIDLQSKTCPPGHNCSDPICNKKFPMIDGTYRGATLRQQYFCSRSDSLYLFILFDPMKKEFIIFPDWTTTPSKTKLFLKQSPANAVARALHEENSLRVPPLKYLPQIRIDSRSSIAEFRGFPENLTISHKADLIKLNCFAARNISGKIWFNEKGILNVPVEGGEILFQGAETFYRRSNVANLLCSSDLFLDEVSWSGSTTGSSSKDLGFEHLRYRIFEHDRFVKLEDFAIWENPPAVFGNQKVYVFKKGAWQIRALFETFLKFFRYENEYPSDLYFKVEPSIEDFYNLPPVVYIQDKMGRWMKYLLEAGTSPG